tara:strand:+ start:1568 stop:1810 length:243 start_codon:yes stop_codon:yes gene_type:complete
MIKGKENMSLLDKELTELESVGTALDPKTGMTYPMYVDGTHDEEMGVHLEDIDDDWFHHLSPEDNVVVNEVMLELGILNI